MKQTPPHQSDKSASQAPAKPAPRSHDKQTLRIFWEAALHEKHSFLLALFFPLGAIFMTVLVPLVIGRIIAALSTTGQITAPAGGHDAASYVPWLIACAVLGVVFNRIGSAFLFTAQAKTMGWLQEKSFAALMQRSMRFHNDRIGGKLVSDAIDYPNAFAMLLDALFTNLFPFVLIMLCGSIIVFIESWQLGAMVTVMCAFTVASAYWSTKRRYGIRLRRIAKVKEVTGHTADAIVNVPTIKAFAQEAQELRQQRKLNKELVALRVSDWQSGARDGSNRIGALMALQVIFILLLIHAVQNDPSVLAASIFAFSFVGMISQRLLQLGMIMRQIEDGFLNAEPMTKILVREPEIQDAPKAKKLAVNKGSVDFNQVAFRYEDAKHHKHVFTGLDLHIKPGERIGLVGPSGGGKSTLTRLLMRFEDIHEGTIAIDGQNIASITQESLRKAIAYVPQEPLLFHRSVAENIAYGKPGASIAEIEKAAKLAYAHEFIRTLSDGYDTLVGERGVKLSGGQRQRIAIARAILKDAPILVLDEATSALDSESEVHIQKALHKLMRGRTTLVIAHRLSTIQEMDRIIVLDDGHVTEQGSHKELLDQKGTYAKLWAHQSGGFIED